MAITQVDLKFQGQNAETSVDTSGKRTHTFSDVYQVISDNPNEEPSDVGDASLIPDIFQQHPVFLTARCQSIAPKRRSGTRLVWDVDVKYVTGLIDKDLDPLARDPVVSASSSQYQKVFTQDRNGLPYITSAGEPYDAESRLGDDARWVFNISANVSIVPAWVLVSNNHLNTASVVVYGLTFAAEVLKLQGLGVVGPETENNIEFYILSFQLHFRKEGWQRILLDAGFQFLLSGTLPAPIEINNERPSSPVLLDGSGGILANPQTPANAFFNTFDDYPLMDLTQLPGITAV